jgi:uncharacterized protein
MLSLLPDYADPERLCGLGKVYQGRLALSDLPRLSAVLAEPTGEASFSLVFGMDVEKRSIISVSVQAGLVVQCQRCLDTMVQPVESHTKLAVVRGPDEAGRLPAELDPLIVDGDPVNLRSLVEDELLLAVPNAPMHREADCAVSLESVNTVVRDAMPSSADEGPQASPFAALAGLKRSGGNND